MLWLALYLPQLPLQSMAAPAQYAFCLTKNETAPALWICNETAMRMGLRPGMPLAAAYSLCPNLIHKNRDTEREQQALHQLAAWALQFTAKISLDSAYALLLEIGGSERYFGNREQLLQRIHAGLNGMGYAYTHATAPTPLSALWLARSRKNLVVTEIESLPAILNHAPLAVMDVPSSLQQKLQQTGLHTLGDCLRLPRAEFVHRYGKALYQRFDQALGKAADPRAYYIPPLRFQAEMEWMAEIEQVEALLFPARRLLLQLEGFLRAHNKGVQQWHMQLHHPGGNCSDIRLETVQAGRDGAQWLALLQTKMHNLVLPGPVIRMTLCADRVQNRSMHNASLLPDERQQQESRDLWLNRMHARLGSQAVRGLQLAADHRPEKSWRFCAPGQTSAAVPYPERPLWLLKTAEPLQYRGNGLYRQQHRLELKQGPERIASGWWDGKDCRRDYFIAIDQKGIRYWVYCERNHWYLHGLFG